MTDELKNKGLVVDKESLAQRVKNRRTIKSLEDAQDKKFKEQLGISDNSDDDQDLEVDQQLKMDEGDRRGRSDKKKLLGKRSRNQDSDDEMMSDDADPNDIDMRVRGSLGKSKRSLTKS